MKRRVCLLFFTLVFSVVLAGAESLSILSLNVWSGLGESGVIKMKELEQSGSVKFRQELLVREVKALDPDVIILQGVNPLPVMAENLAEEMDRDVVYQAVRAGVRIGPVGLPYNLREGFVILARRGLELEAIDSMILSGGPGGNLFSISGRRATGILGARITFKEKPVYLFSAVWTSGMRIRETDLVRWARAYADGDLDGESYEERLSDSLDAAEKRREESLLTLEFINKTAGASPAILAGTLQGGMESPEIERFIQSGFRDSFSMVSSMTEPVTWDESGNLLIRRYALFREPGHRTQIKPDYTLVRGDEVEILRSSVVFGRPSYGSHPSTHYGILTEVQF